MSNIVIPASNIMGSPEFSKNNNKIDFVSMSVNVPQDVKQADLGTFEIYYFLPSNNENKPDVLVAIPTIIVPYGTANQSIILKNFTEYDGQYNLVASGTEFEPRDTDYEIIHAETESVLSFIFEDMSKALFLSNDFYITRKRYWYNLLEDVEAEKEYVEEITTRYFYNIGFRNYIYGSIDKDEQIINIPKFTTDPNNYFKPDRVNGIAPDVEKDITCVRHQEWYLLHEEIHIWGDYREITDKSRRYVGGASGEYDLELVQSDIASFVQDAYFRNWFSSILAKNDKNTSTSIIKCLVGDYYDEDGNLVVCPEPTEINTNYPMLIPMYSKVVPYVMRNNVIQPLQKNADGTPTIYEVIGNDFEFEGVPMQNLTLKEFVE